MAKKITITDKEKAVLDAVLNPLQDSDYFENVTLPEGIKTPEEALKILDGICNKLSK